MKHFLPLLLVSLLIPAYAGAANSSIDPDISTTTNTYIAAQDVRITKKLPADIVTAGATVSISAPVEGDVLAAGGALDIAQGAADDVRVAGFKVRVAGPVGGDIAAAAGTLGIYGSAKTIYGAGWAVDVRASSTGNVTLYGADVTLGGNYGGNVSVITSNRLTLLPGTHIQGTLKYSAPQQLILPESVLVDGGVSYTGSYSYLPTSEQVHQYAVAGAGIFFLVRVLAGSIVAGLIAGLFRRPVQHISEMVLRRDPLHALKLLLLGLCVGVLGPLVLLFLFVSLVGAALGVLLTVLYALLLVLAYTSCGIVLGYFLRQTILQRLYGTDEFQWQDAIIGTVLIHMVGFVPLIGTLLVFLLSCVCAGALLSITSAVLIPALPQQFNRDTLKTYE